MKFRNILIAIGLCAATSAAFASEMRYAGGDISLLPNYEKAGVTYKDMEGNKIELLPYLQKLGMNAMRVRLFVDPGAFPGKQDDNACQDLPYILPLGKDIVDNGFDLMLDFHYSDTWADPEKQWIPEAWKGLNDEVLADSVYNYTKSSLKTLKANGITPTFIQPGNEISYGMLWAAYGGNPEPEKVYINQREQKWQRFGMFLKSAIAACREECPDAKIVIHTERVSQVDVLKGFYQQMEKLEIDYDIIGLSYYPYYHGPFTQLNLALTTLEQEFPDIPIMIVETGFPLYWGFDDKIYDVEYGTPELQNRFAEDLVALLLEHKNVDGLFWWWLEYNPYISDNNKLSNWYNAPLFDPNTGKALPATKTIASFATSDAGIDVLEAVDEPTNSLWFDINGRQIPKPELPGIYIHNHKKILIK